ncbi:hypothetical protein [Arthrobacter sp. ISL-85]|uniref:hypothetical protein n=1 Tax=Arthrobacter sp. ISL-85 TaxID=2819115 RepID=UPI001BE9B033|nr:hypothetical protein [Arthrobacter sp. ISL-85]
MAPDALPGEAAANGSGPKETVKKKILLAGGITLIGLAMGLVALAPNDVWTPAWGNFFGALIVALGGLFGCLHASKLATERVVPLSWSCIVVGGFVIAGASLQMALNS